MSGQVDHVEDHAVWQPPPRCIDKRCAAQGHRVERHYGFRPIETRQLNFWAKLAEFPMRWLARSIPDADATTFHQETPDNTSYLD